MGYIWYVFAVDRIVYIFLCNYFNFWLSHEQKIVKKKSSKQKNYSKWHATFLMPKKSLIQQIIVNFFFFFSFLHHTNKNQTIEKFILYVLFYVCGLRMENKERKISIIDV
jgi:uncharacterized membrane protein YbjE (DUF340 family)